MPRRASTKKPEDANQAAHRVVRELTGDEEHREPPKREKNPAAVALGKLGASKGGKARAKALTPEERQEIARKAAKKRWGDTPEREP